MLASRRDAPAAQEKRGDGPSLTHQGSEPPSGTLVLLRTSFDILH